jgi:hypothetical protein
MHASQSFGAGLLLGLSAVTSVFAASGEEPLNMQGVILVASLALLGLGLALKARSIRSIHHKHDAVRMGDTTDLRWWKNP